MKYVLPLLLFPSLALAECPPGEDHSDARAALHTDLLNAESEGAAQAIAGEIWQIWLTAPDGKAQAMLDQAMNHRRVFMLVESEVTLDALIAYCPDYTEGYNQRAFTRFLREDYEGSLADLRIVLDADPYHFGALSGRALNLMRQGRMELAQKAIRDAVAVHPFIQERALLRDGADPI